MSRKNNGLSFQSSKYSRLTEDRQQTAVRSLSVGKMISEHRFDWRTLRPKRFWHYGK